MMVQNIKPEAVVVFNSVVDSIPDGYDYHILEKSSKSLNYCDSVIC